MQTSAQEEAQPVYDWVDRGPERATRSAINKRAKALANEAYEKYRAELLVEFQKYRVNYEDIPNWKPGAGVAAQANDAGRGV
jgi:hypothetical protein